MEFLDFFPKYSKCWAEPHAQVSEGPGGPPWRQREIGRHSTKEAKLTFMCLFLRARIKNPAASLRVGSWEGLCPGHVLHGARPKAPGWLLRRSFPPPKCRHFSSWGLPRNVTFLGQFIFSVVRTQYYRTWRLSTHNSCEELMSVDFDNLSCSLGQNVSTSWTLFFSSVMRISVLLCHGVSVKMKWDGFVETRQPYSEIKVSNMPLLLSSSWKPL